MATILINGQEHILPEGEKLNAIQAAQLFGHDIPYYCWHPALSVVANCRMCEIEVGSKDPKTGEIRMVPKMVPGCQTPAKDGTVLVTASEKVKAHQKMIMELLLINHPLDCPVCDQAGQCGLQDYSYEYGQSSHQFVEERIVNPRKDVSDNIQLNQDRCIMCTRCVRFTREITQTGELQVMNRGNHAEINIFPGHPIDNPLAGNVVDLCPVGALLDKDFLHKQRFWFLSKHDSICTKCSTGCNISSEENRGQIWRFRARYNPKVNDHWICDEGRHSYKAANDPNLLAGMYVRKTTTAPLNPATIEEATTFARDGLLQIARENGTIAGILSPFLTVEEAFAIASYLKTLSPSAVLALGPVPVEGVDTTFTPDQHEGRTGDTSFVVPRPFTIHAEKCPNRQGVEAVLNHFGGFVSYDAISQRIANDEFRGVLVASDAIDPAFADADAKSLRKASFLIVIDTNVTPVAQAADVVLAGATFAEKAGCYVNSQGRLQYSEAALPPRDGSLPDLDLIAILSGKGQGPVSSRIVLAEIATLIPAFAAIQDGTVPEFGILIGGATETKTQGAFPYSDPWHATRNEKVGTNALPRPEVAEAAK